VSIRARAANAMSLALKIHLLADENPFKELYLSS
jgi:hypothetical protein